jgi:hypothetical protein
MQFSHDNLMGENYDISAKLIDCEMWLTSYCRFLYGLGFNLLGYQEREYPDTTILRVSGYHRTSVRLWWNDVIPVELSLAVDGDLGIAEGFIYDNRIDSKITFHVPMEKPSARLLF